ncbi:hypothetical protein F3157_00290 [Virgibacillus dakarensis]|uniref:hypothetical protein n=1 Tax=Virgibacillus dakarensis TaxID=1917889 RepID=UPI000B44361C|nr:hypothetical protein [Virgibacillus dakarensis]MBT2214503.1 hypothetical protein [Virgibacillus dakarensis]MTW84108.1 hypothetical protein [Virgibacillus dakarensis]
MEGLLVILAIIGGVIGLFKDKSTDKTNKKPYQVPKPTATPSGRNYQAERSEPAVHDNARTSTVIEEQRDNQIEQLAEQINTSTREMQKKLSHDAIIGNTLRQPKNIDYQKAAMKKQVRKNLTRKGLVDGIIMAEVLGPPRSRKPYRSVISERTK